MSGGYKDELITEFVTETGESLVRVGQQLIQLKENPDRKDLLNEIHRFAHTIHGTCAFLGLPKLQDFAHHIENVVECFNKDTLQITPEHITLISESIDCIKTAIDHINKSGEEPEAFDAEIIIKLEAAYNSRDESKATVSAESAVDKTWLADLLGEALTPDTPTPASIAKFFTDGAQTEISQPSATPSKVLIETFALEFSAAAKNDPAAAAAMLSLHVMETLTDEATAKLRPGRNSDVRVDPAGHFLKTIFKIGEILGEKTGKGELQERNPDAEAAAVAVAWRGMKTMGVPII